MLGYTQALLLIRIRRVVYVRVYAGIMVHLGSGGLSMLGDTQALWAMWCPEVCICWEIPRHYGLSGLGLPGHYGSSGAKRFVYVRVYPGIMVHQGSEICPC